jgi:hypothetical protein
VRLRVGLQPESLPDGMFVTAARKANLPCCPGLEVIFAATVVPMVWNVLDPGLRTCTTWRHEPPVAVLAAVTTVVVTHEGHADRHDDRALHVVQVVFRPTL